VFTWRAFVEMLAELLSDFGFAFTVDELPYHCDQFGALGLDAWVSICREVTGAGCGRKLGHDDTSSGA
jgi:hypothetical protein